MDQEGEWGRTPRLALDEAIRADNKSFEAARNTDVILGIHLCRGNNRNHWYAQGGYDAIAEKLFGTLKADRFLLEYDDERAGSFEPLRLVPKDKIVVLGLVSTKNPTLESADDVIRRIEEAAKYFPIENLTLSPQCGFASTMEGNLLSEDAAVGEGQVGRRCRATRLELILLTHVFAAPLVPIRKTPPADS